MSGEPVHVEFGVPDTVGAQRFYGELFGWEFEPTGNGARIRTGGIPGGLHPDERGPEVLVFYSVPDLEEEYQTFAVLLDQSRPRRVIHRRSCRTTKRNEGVVHSLEAAQICERRQGLLKRNHIRHRRSPSQPSTCPIRG